MVKRIVSSENILIKKISSLRLKKFRDKEGLYLTEGLRICEDILLDKGKEEFVKNIILTEKNEDLLLRAPFSMYKDKSIIIGDKLEKEITDTVTSQGIFLLLKKESPKLEDYIKSYSRLLILDHISDPGNMGTIIRTALASKFDALISLKGSVDIHSPKVIRATMGAINKIDIYENLDENQTLIMLKEKGFKLVAGDIEGEKTIYDHFPEEKIALVMGSEAKGIKISEEFIDLKVTIPMSEKTESLNVSVASGILMYAINKSKFEK